MKFNKLTRAVSWALIINPHPFEDCFTSNHFFFVLAERVAFEINKQEKARESDVFLMCVAEEENKCRRGAIF